MSNQVLSPAPYQSQIVDKSGMLTIPWVNWIRQLYIQTGAASSTSLTSLINTVAELSAQVTSNTADIGMLQTEVNDLNLGHEL